jgi:hypothetical protein
VVVLSAAIAVCLVGATVANAAVRAGSETFNPNKPGPTFGGGSNLPLITISVSYDDAAGTLAVSETGGDPSYFTGFERFDAITLTGTQAPALRISGDWNYPMAPTLADTAVNGSLTAQSFTKSSDGSTLTAVFSDPALAGQALTFVTVDPTATSDNMCGCDVPPGGSFYFPGYTPSVTITTPAAQRTQAGTPLGVDECGDNGPCCVDADANAFPCPGVPVSATEVGLATGVYGDDGGFSTDGTGPADVSVTGLPPGLTLNGNQITGKPSTTGTYTPTITASATYAYGTQTTAATSSFTWVITPKPTPPKPKPKPAPIPVVAAYDGAGPHGRGLQKRPFTIIWTGDGTGILGGTGTGRSMRHFGRLHWSSWTATQAKATGRSWVNNCTPSCAGGRYASYPATVALTRPQRLHGYVVFTRLTVTYTRGRPRYMGRSRSFTLKLQWASSSGFGWG